MTQCGREDGVWEAGRSLKHGRSNDLPGISDPSPREDEMNPVGASRAGPDFDLDERSRALILLRKIVMKLIRCGVSADEMRAVVDETVARSVHDE